MLLINTIITGFLLTTTAFGASRSSFTWSDINTREVIRWDGDIAVIQHGAAMEEISCRVKINDSSVEFAINSFGIPKSWTSFSYHDEIELKEKQKYLSENAAKHGIKMHRDGNKFSVDYKWVIDQSKGSIRDIAKAIKSSARKKGYRTKRELVGAFTSFVQSLSYRIPSNYRINKEGETILTAGAMVPLETLSNKWGDCDSKCMLFASLVRSIDLVDVIFIIMKEHIFAGVQVPTQQDEHTVRYKNQDWALVELTDAWPIGRVPSNHLNGVLVGKFEIVNIK
jgi:hypothetical protein